MASIIDNIQNFFRGSKEDASLTRASKGTIRNSLYGGLVAHRQTSYGKQSPENLNLILKTYQKDPVVQAAITTRVNAILSSGYTIEGARSRKDEFNTKLKKLGFNYNLLWQMVINGLLYDHVFVEVERRNDGTPVQLHVLETPYMEIQHDEHGEIESFIQRGEQGDPVIFPPEDIVYMRFNAVSSAVWGEVGLKTLYRTLSTKNQIENFLNYLASTNAWRMVMKTKMSDENITEFLSYYHSQSDNPEEMLTLRSTGAGADDVDKDTKFEVLRSPQDLKEFLGTLDYLRTQILMQLKVPPIMIGLPDSSNRSNSDMQFKAFNIANESFRKVMAGYFQELMEKIGISTAEFSWNPIDERSEKDDVEIAERLMNMGAKPKQIEAFLRAAGLELPEGELFEDLTLVPSKTRSVRDSVAGKSDDMYPSRKGKADGESNEKIGSGVEGTTREDQL